MNTDSSVEDARVEIGQIDVRLDGDDRRTENERRKSAQGLYEVRARREGIVTDRRLQERRTSPAGRVWDALFRRVK